MYKINQPTLMKLITVYLWLAKKLKQFLDSCPLFGYKLSFKSIVILYRLRMIVKIGRFDVKTNKTFFYNVAQL